MAPSGGLGTTSLAEPDDATGAATAGSWAANNACAAATTSAGSRRKSSRLETAGDPSDPRRGTSTSRSLRQQAANDRIHASRAAIRVASSSESAFRSVSGSSGSRDWPEGRQPSTADVMTSAAASSSGTSSQPTMSIASATGTGGTSSVAQPARRSRASPSGPAATASESGIVAIWASCSPSERRLRATTRSSGASRSIIVPCSVAATHCRTASAQAAASTQLCGSAFVFFLDLPAVFFAAD